MRVAGSNGPEASMRRHPALVLALVLSTACVPHHRLNTDCRWVDDAAGVLDLSNSTQRDHLTLDVIVAEELAVRYANARTAAPRGPVTRASAGVAPRSPRTKRRTLAYRGVKPWSLTRSCQIATAFRPRPSAATISSRYGSQALALGARAGAARGTAVGTTLGMTRGTTGRSVETPVGMAAFAGASPGRPRPRTSRPAARK